LGNTIGYIRPHTGIIFELIKSGGKMMVHDYNDPGYRHMSVLNLAGFLARSEVNGPGTRAVVWVQGCPHRCKGCFNEQFQSFSPAQLVDIRDLADTILSLANIDGVTFSGGEPFAQAGPLAALGQQLRSAGLNIVTYSGYTCEQLASGTDPAWPALLAVSDLLIAGPYIADLTCLHLMAGSSNQQVIPLGTKIQSSDKISQTESAGGRSEFTIAPDGSIITSGFPTPAFLVQLASHCRGE
jgi:anaerobic ribonucleoside-triphosphate reductase activating protein